MVALPESEHISGSRDAPHDAGLSGKRSLMTSCEFPHTRRASEFSTSGICACYAEVGVWLWFVVHFGLSMECMTREYVRRCVIVGGALCLRSRGPSRKLEGSRNDGGRPKTGGNPKRWRDFETTEGVRQREGARTPLIELETIEEARQRRREPDNGRAPENHC